MFARFTITQVDVNKIDETIKLYEDSVVPTAKTQKGFRGITLYTIAKQAKDIQFPYGIVRRTPLQLSRVAITRNNWANLQSI